ncbi:MAG: ArnT family glycosyltransferase [Candidatus Hodarchaeales archaeon]
MKKHFRILIILAIFTVAGYMRFSNIRQNPGYEWDEPIYVGIAERVNEIGYPNIKGEGNIFNTEPYLYHPPFDFYLKSFWFQLVEVSDIGSSRILSAIEAMIMLGIAYFCLKEVSGKKTAIIGLLLLATDGWLVYTSRLNMIENAMMVIGVLGIWMYIKATKTGITLYYLIAGIFLTFAAIYKHTGIPLIAVPFVNLLLIRKEWKNHLVLIQTMIIVVLVYVAAMWAIWGELYTFQTWVQMERAFGNIGSRGLNFSVTDAISAIVQTYWVYTVTILLIISMGGIIGFRIVQSVLRGKELSNSVLLSWAIVSFSFLAVIALKAPHYLITVLVPGYMFVASEIGNILERIERNSEINKKEEPLKKRKRSIVFILVGLAVLLNMFTWSVRFIQPYDNALGQTYGFFSTIPITKNIIADDCVGVAIQQPYFNLDRHSSEQGIKDANPDYLVLYTSQTQKTPDSQDLNALILNSTLVQRFTGFKEIIEVYQVNRP